MSSTQRQRRVRYSAKTADKHVLYEESVQEVDADIKFVSRVYKKKHGVKPMILREDFCGTARMCASWVKSDKNRKAIGVDLDQPTLDWGLKRHFAQLGDRAKQVKLLCQNVLTARSTPADVTVALNFSYWIFKERHELKKYFQAARKHLKPGGAFVLDIYGGPDAQIVSTEDRKMEGFTYIWEQGPYNAFNAHAKRYIHFRFPDGTQMRKAFVYDWRIWSLPEVQDLLYDAGFSQVDLYWEGCDEDGDGNGVFRQVRQVENEECWIAYVVGWR